MSVAEDSTIRQLRASLLEGMREYMSYGDVTYDESHIASCDAILARHLEALDSAQDRESSLSLVKETVLALNELNARCESGLIETDQRETICALLIRGGAIRGFNASDEDLTEEWREW